MQIVKWKVTKRIALGGIHVVEVQEGMKQAISDQDAREYASYLDVVEEKPKRFYVDGKTEKKSSPSQKKKDA